MSREIRRRKEETMMENERQGADPNERASHSRRGRNERGLFALPAPQRVSRRYHATAVYMPQFSPRVMQVYPSYHTSLPPP